MKSILDPSFRYTTSFNTDLRRTFARVRRDHRNASERAAQATTAAAVNVSPLVRKSVNAGKYG